MPSVLTEAQVREIEAQFPEGLTSQEIVGVFAARQVKFTEATLRKYVQLGLIPRSRRVGLKGKHLGSHGVYPLRTVRRINTIKRLMDERFTIEEIQRRFLTFKDAIETLDEAIAELLSTFAQKIDEHPPSPRRERLHVELGDLRGVSDRLLEGAHRLEKLLIAATSPPRPRGGGAVSPTELL
jgi:DNA-binding transcriptional MerR regulator